MTGEIHVIENQTRGGQEEVVGMKDGRGELGVRSVLNGV